ncbi:MAG: GNAT family N-acetyltransferase [Crocinitomicaceae bacterium]
MLFRDYEPADHESCLKIFDSNCPPYFDSSERDLFDNWLTAIDEGGIARESIEKSYYFVGEWHGVVVSCGGIYSMFNKSEVRLSWGMVSREHHRKGLGKALFRYRFEAFQKRFPEFELKLDTSQLTFPFYERMNFVITHIEKNGYGPDLDKYEMTYRQE